jgi:hypothetical protein
MNESGMREADVNEEGVEFGVVTPTGDRRRQFTHDLQARGISRPDHSVGHSRM